MQDRPIKESATFLLPPIPSAPPPSPLLVNIEEAMCERRGGPEGGRRHGQRQKARMVREEKGRAAEGKLMSSESRQCAGSV